MQPEVDEDLRSHAVIAQVRLKSQLQIRLDRIAALVLQPIGPDLVEQADAAPFLIQIEQDPAPFLLNHVHRLMELVAAVAPDGAQHIGRQTTGMHADERPLPAIDSPFH